MIEKDGNNDKMTRSRIAFATIMGVSIFVGGVSTVSDSIADRTRSHIIEALTADIQERWGNIEPIDVIHHQGETPTIVHNSKNTYIAKLPNGEKIEYHIAIPFTQPYTGTITALTIYAGNCIGESKLTFYNGELRGSTPGTRICRVENPCYTCDSLAK